jgi:hypothetical protein
MGTANAYFLQDPGFPRSSYPYYVHLVHPDGKLNNKTGGVSTGADHSIKDV